jgi:hypothetical protein
VAQQQRRESVAERLAERPFQARPGVLGERDAAQQVIDSDLGRSLDRGVDHRDAEGDDPEAAGHVGGQADRLGAQEPVVLGHQLPRARSPPEHRRDPDTGTVRGDERLGQLERQERLLAVRDDGALDDRQPQPAVA